MIKIGIAGRLTEIKNHKMFLFAISYLEGFNAEYYIIGDGELREELERFAKCCFVNPIFTGWQYDMLEVYKNLDIVVCTSDNEGTPVSLIEAATFGLPIISTDVGSIKEIFKDNGAILLVEKNDHEGLAEAIKQMVNNLTEYKEKAKEFKKVCYNRFRKERLIEDIKELYGVERSK